MTAIIIDDEPDNVKLLALQLNRHCPQVEVVGQFTDSTEGLYGIQTHRPSLVFLDIEMPVMNGFQLLERVGRIDFQVVFVTAYDQYAVRAFRF
jgi:two-component system LytT family response regulator